MVCYHGGSWFFSVKERGFYLVAFFSLCDVGMGREKMSQSKFPVFAVVALWKINATTYLIPTVPLVFPPKKIHATSSIVYFI